MPFYAVVSGKNPGIYTNWDDCREQITNYPGAWYKKFKSEYEADRCMKSKEIALKSSGLNAYTAQRIAEYVPPSWASPNARAMVPSPDAFSTQVRASNTRENERLGGKEKLKWRKNMSTDHFTLKVPGISKRRSYIEKNVTSMFTSPPDIDQAHTCLPVLPPCFDYWGHNNNPMPYAFDSNWLHAIHTNQIYVPPLIEDYEGFIDVYIDGAVTRKQGSKPKGGIGVWFNHAHPLNVTAPIEGTVSPINAEIQAATRAVQQAAAAGLTRLNIHTDSLYLVKSVTEWIKIWRKNHWQTTSGKTVKYRVALERLSDVLGCMDAVRWIHIKSHQGNEGNESADTLARNGVNFYGIKQFDAYHIKGSPDK